MCTCVTVGLSSEFWCAAGGIGYVSSGMMRGARWGGHPGACPGWKYMSPCRPTVRGGAGAAYGVSYGVSILRFGVGVFCRCSIAFSGVGTCGEAAMLKISANLFRVNVCLRPIIMSGIVGVWLRISWVSSVAVRVSASSEYILGNGNVTGKNSMVLDTCSLDVLGI